MRRPLRMGGRQESWPPPRRWELVAVVAIVAGVGALAVLRWTGHAPFGSDHDEYRMLAAALWEQGEPTVAGGVEGTKYPLGYSLVLGGLAQLGLPITGTAMAINLALVVVLVVGTWVVGRRVHSVGGLVAAAVVAVSPTLWNSVYVVMPDLALAAVTLAAFGWVWRLADGDGGAGRVRGRARAIAVAAGLALAAVALKTFGIVLAGALAVAMLLHRRWRAWSWVPVTVGALGVIVQGALVAPYPEHTTGYAATFWLRDPTDAALGRIDVIDLPARVADRLLGILVQTGRAVVGAHVPGWLATAVLVVMVTAVAVRVRRWRWPFLAHVGGSLLVLAAWPYRDARFGLPMLPLLAVGAAVLVAAAAGRLAQVPDRWWVRLPAGLLLLPLAVHVPVAVEEIRTDGAAEEGQLAELHAAMDDLAAWAEGAVRPGETIASMDYREVAYRLDRPVTPIPYTTDPEALWAATGGAGAEWLVSIRGLYGARDGIVDILVSDRPERFRRVLATDHIRAYRIVSPSGGP